MGISDEIRKLDQTWQSTQTRLLGDHEEDLKWIRDTAAGRKDLAQSNYDTDYGLATEKKQAADAQQNETTDKALGDAYVSKMLNARNLNQQLAAMGRSGGAAESTLLGLQNNYQTNRAGLESERAQILAKILDSYNTTVGDLAKTRSGAITAAEEWAGEQEAAARNQYQTLLESARAAYNSERNQLLAIKAQQEAAAAAAAAAAAQAAGRSAPAPVASDSAPAATAPSEKAQNLAKTFGPMMDGRGAAGVVNIISGIYGDDYGKVFSDEDIAQAVTLMGGRL